MANELTGITSPSSTLLWRPGKRLPKPGRLLILLFSILLTTSILSACGQKGPLYLPSSSQQPDGSDK